MICPTGKAKYFSNQGWTAELSDAFLICPTGSLRVKARRGPSNPSGRKVLKAAAYSRRPQRQSRVLRNYGANAARHFTGSSRLSVQTRDVMRRPTKSSFHRPAMQTLERLHAEPGREPINPEWLADFRFDTHSLLKSDIA
jgi:hypothetical protein